MCTTMWFAAEKRHVGTIAELADVLGGFDKIAVYSGYGGLRELRKTDSCLCPVNVERTFKGTDYILSQWEDGCDYTVRKPEWLLELERQAADGARYEAAMAEMHAAQAIEARSAKPMRPARPVA